MTNLRNPWLTAALVSLSCWCVGFLPPALLAQEKETKLLMRVDSEKAPRALNVVYVRPNAMTTMALHLQNLSVDVPNNATIKLVQMVGNQPRVIGQATLNPAGKDAPLVFVKAKDAPDKIDLSSPPFKLQLLVEAGGKRHFEKDFDLRIRSAHDLVTASCKYEKSTRQLRFKVTLKETFDAKGCPVELVLGPGFKDTKKGTFKQVLTNPNQTVELFAEGIEFRPGVNSAEGRVYLNVNGYDRAFIFQATLKESGDLVEIPFDNEVGARLRAPLYALPSEKFKIGLEMDGGLDVGQVEVGLDRTGKKEQFQVQTFPSLRKQKVQLSVSPTGELVWQTEVRDWEAEFDTADVFGPVWFRVRVLSGTREIDVVPAVGKRSDEPLLKIDTDFPRSLFARVILDGTKPENIEFVDLPKKWCRGKQTTVQAKAALRPPERLAPIDKVTFFQGKAAPDGKINPDAVLGEGKFDAVSGLWKAEIAVPEKESFDLSVQFVTVAGLAASDSKKVFTTVCDNGPSKWATVKGSVVYGERGQSDITVTLSDGNGKIKRAVKTNAKGEFAFDRVLPGSYFVTAVRNFPELIGQVPLEVPEGQEIVDNVAVRLKAK